LNIFKGEVAMKIKALYYPLVSLMIGLLLSSGVIIGEVQAAKKSVLKMGWPETPQNGLNVTGIKSGSEFAFAATLYEPLFIVQLKGGMVPWLGSGWRYDTAQDAWYIYLDKRAQWHDGMPVTAEDVKFTFETAFKYDLTAGGSLKPYINSIVAVDKHTVRFNMKRKYANFLWGAAGTMIIPKHIWSKVGDVTKFLNPNPIGSGPFKFKTFKPGKYMHLVKNENYWRGPVHIDELIYRVYLNEDAMYMAFLKGEIQVLPEIRGTFGMIPKFKRDPNIQMVVAQGPFATHMPLNHRRYPYGIKEVRHAISWALDRKEIIEVGFEGYAEEPLLGFLSPLYAKYANFDLTWPGKGMSKADRLKKANAILDGLGFKMGSDGVRVTDQGNKMTMRLLQPNWPSFVRTAEIMAENLKEIGIAAKVQSADPNTTYGTIYHKEGIDKWEALGPHNSTVKGLEYMSKEWGPEVKQLWYNANAVAWSNSEAKGMFTKLRSEMDEAKKIALVKKAQAAFAEDMPSVILCHKNLLFAYRTDEFAGWNEEMVLYGNFYYPAASLLTLTALYPTK
jgi:peptide/nickel transport system substrate-binding protein